MSGLADQIVAGLATQARRDIAASRAIDAARPVGEVRLDIDFYSKADRDKPIDDGEMMLHGTLVRWTGARWCVAKYKWTGSEWKRLRRISGPLKFTPALERRTEEARRTGLKIVGSER